MDHRRNPSPPPEFENNQEFRSDKIGESAISKQWVLATLMEIINVRLLINRLDWTWLVLRNIP